jgi:tripartite-type tricarboxylate transporter receptor subunit TctC
LGCFFWGQVWTLAAWCEARQAFRSFRLDRMTQLERLDERFRDEAGKTLADLLELAKRQPGKLSYSSGGNGTPAHVMGEYFKQLTGTFILHVPYRGPVAALQDLIGGQSDMMFASVAAAVPHVQSGRLQALAVTARQPLAALPGVPTFAEAGFTGFDVRDWAGIVAPRSLPAASVAPLNAAIVQALGEPGLAERFAQMGTYLHTGTPQAFEQLIRAELPKWGEVVRKAGIRVD